MLIALSLQGCATYSTISAAKPGSPKIYSGTRLDLNAIQGNEQAQLKFKVDPPEHPKLDLPFSILFDTIMLPLSFSISGYEFLFGAD
jgi:uncharacterized protein YceK